MCRPYSVFSGPPPPPPTLSRTPYILFSPFPINFSSCLAYLISFLSNFSCYLYFLSTYNFPLFFLHKFVIFFPIPIPLFVFLHSFYYCIPYYHKLSIIISANFSYRSFLVSYVNHHPSTFPLVLTLCCSHLLLYVDHDHITQSFLLFFSYSFFPICNYISIYLNYF